MHIKICKLLPWRNNYVCQCIWYKVLTIWHFSFILCEFLPFLLIFIFSLPKCKKKNLEKSVVHREFQILFHSYLLTFNTCWIWGWSYLMECLNDLKLRTLPVFSFLRPPFPSSQKIIKKNKCHVFGFHDGFHNCPVKGYMASIMF